MSGILTMSVKEFVGNRSDGKVNHVFFASYRQGYFYYRVAGKSNGLYWEFPVPIDDIGTATMLDQDKSITFMRWIRKAIDEGTLIPLK